MSTATLAIVDDDRPFADYLTTLLQSRGYETVAYDGGDALLAALREGASHDVVLLDVLMPGLDGLETLRAIRLAQPGAQVVMLSGGQTPATIVEAVRLGATDYVVKPGDPDGVGEVALEAAIRNALERLALTAEVNRLRSQVDQDPDGAQPCWSSGKAMARVMTVVDRVADSDVSVLLRGESGVGKEVIAREIHRRSPRRGGAFVKVNCAALPAELLESELFGHERGAFTGATATRIGKFEFAHHGTIMLDEVGEMPIALQAKILHVLQDREFNKLGSNRVIDVDVRIIAATNRDLEVMIRAGTFREDLYYRLQVIEVVIPPLRERREEIPQLIEFFLLKFAALYGRPATRPSLMLQETLLAYDWPGNIRELENIMKRLVVLQDEGLILSELSRVKAARAAAEGLEPALHGHGNDSGVNLRSVSASAPVALIAPPPAPVAPMPFPASGDSVNLHELARHAAMGAEREAIQQALERFRWNRRKAAEYLQVSYKTLLNKMKECGIGEGGTE
ncbi:MAG: sigma-54 dependent transcriptional regulator [Vicinamibacterales bacterium]